MCMPHGHKGPDTFYCASRVNRYDVFIRFTEPGSLDSKLKHGIDLAKVTPPTDLWVGWCTGTEFGAGSNPRIDVWWLLPENKTTKPYYGHCPYYLEEFLFLGTATMLTEALPVARDGLARYARRRIEAAAKVIADFTLYGDGNMGTKAVEYIRSCKTAKGYEDSGVETLMEHTLTSISKG